MIHEMIGNNFNLLKSTTHIKQSGKILSGPWAAQSFLQLLKASGSRELVVDFETTGLDVRSDSFRAVGVALAAKPFPEGIYIPLKANAESAMFLQSLCQFDLIGHNVSFDAAVMEVELRRDFLYKPLSKWPWKNDTLIMYKMLASEGFPGQKWSLKAAQTDVLGWEETNEVELDNWLIENGYHRAGKPLKGEMWRAPVEILGQYAALDAQSTLALYEYLQRCSSEFEDVRRLQEREIQTLMRLEMRAFFKGFRVADDLLTARLAKVNAVIDALMNRFLYESEAAPIIQEFNAAQVLDIEDKEPPRYKKDGKEAVRWQKWSAKLEEARSTMFFNPNSKQQLCWLFYDNLFETTAMQREVSKRGDIFYFFEVVVNGRPIKVDGTPTGNRKIDKKILPKLGEAGRILAVYNELVKLRGYMEGMLNHTHQGVHHPRLRIYGTLTGRCSGTGGLNLQQVPKVREYLDCLQARPGHKLISFDFHALEPVVLTELSQDSALWGIYGPGAPKNDIYLFIGAQIPALRDEITRYGYDPNNPDPEAIAITKKKAKKWRAVCKVVHLAAGYGAGPGKIWATLLDAGIDISFEEVKEIHRAYWELFEGVVRYQKDLEAEYDMNGGWFLNGRGVPMPVAGSLRKDILNRCIQSTGHWNLLTYLVHLERLIKKSELPIEPVVIDYHDETDWEVPEEHVDAAVAIFEEALRLTNEELGGNIPLSGEPEICDTFSDFKCEGGYRLDEIITEFKLEVA